MSATLDADVLSMYFDDCPDVHIEGLAYPVTDVYLEDILKITNYQLPDEKREKKQPKWMQHRNKGRQTAGEMERDIQYKAEVGKFFQSLLDLDAILICLELGLKLPFII